jgi:hypothetical protein
VLELILEAFGSDQLVDVDDFVKLCVRFTLNLAATWVVVKRIYVRLYKWNEFVFTYFAFSIVTFSLCLILRKVPIELGFALGLFAVFGILRYRTEPIRIRDLTYLFVVIGISILNAVSNRHVSLAELLAINGAIVGCTYVLEFRGRGNRRTWKTVTYDRIELVTPERRAELYADLKERLGLNVVGVEVLHADLLRDVAKLNVECIAEGAE